MVTILLFSNLLALATQHVNLVHKFSIDYDAANWSLIEGEFSKPKTSVPSQADFETKTGERTLLTLQNKKSTEKYKARVSLVKDSSKFVKGLKGPFQDKFLAYQKHAAEFLKNQRFTIESQEPKTVANQKAIEITAYQNDFGLRFRQSFFFKGEDVYLLTAATRIAEFESLAPQIEKITQSLQFER